jgi:tetratricopeptide (TPR) repeat protein
VICRMRGRIEDAATHWEKALEIDPDHGFALFNLGRVYLELGRREKALAALGHYLEMYGVGLADRDRREVRRLIDRCLIDDQR